MKTAREFADDLLDAAPDFSAFYELVSARDAEHAAESKAREEALRKERDNAVETLIQMNGLVFRLKGELELAKEGLRITEEANVRGGLANEQLKGELAEARELIGNLSRQRPCPGCTAEGEHYGWCNLAKAVPSPAEPPTFEQLVERAGPLPTTQLASASPAESTGVRGMLCAFCEGHGRVPPLHNSTCNLCRGTGLRQPAAPPDDIGERLEALRKAVRAIETDYGERLKSLETKVADEAADSSKSWLDHEERLKAMEQWRKDVDERLRHLDRMPKAAPQEQAGHAFVHGATEACADCRRPFNAGIHTGAKP